MKFSLFIILFSMYDLVFCTGLPEGKSLEGDYVVPKSTDNTKLPGERSIPSFIINKFTNLKLHEVNQKIKEKLVKAFKECKESDCLLPSSRKPIIRSVV